MARLLIKATDAKHVDPVVDKAGSYKRGDVVAIMPDGHTWGGAEGLPNFLQVDTPQSVEAIQHLTESAFDLPNDFENRKTISRRRYSVDLSLLELTSGRGNATPIIPVIDKNS